MIYTIQAYDHGSHNTPIFLQNTMVNYVKCFRKIQKYNFANYFAATMPLKAKTTVLSCLKSQDVFYSLVF